MPANTKLKEETWFIKDSSDIQSNEEKNSRLSDLLEGEWNDLAIVRIERIEIGTAKGWKITYRK